MISDFFQHVILFILLVWSVEVLLRARRLKKIISDAKELFRIVDGYPDIKTPHLIDQLTNDQKAVASHDRYSKILWMSAVVSILFIVGILLTSNAAQGFVDWEHTMAALYVSAMTVMSRDNKETKKDLLEIIIGYEPVVRQLERQQ